MRIAGYDSRPSARRRRTSAAVLVAALAIAPSARAMWPFSKQKRYTSESLIDAGSLGLKDVKGRVVALGDINGDQNTDLFVVADDKRTIQVYAWERASFTYKLNQILKAPHDVVNIVPADFNADGRLDILLMMMDQGEGGWWSGGGSHQVDMRVIFGSDHGLNQDQPHWDLDPSMIQQPILFDDDGTMRASLLGFMSSKEGPTVRSWRNNGTFMNSFPTALYPSDAVCSLAIPHSSAYIDIDGDCQPDLVLHCQRASANNRALQIWLGRGESGYVLSKTFELPRGSRAVTFADMNRDGSLDIIFATCSKHQPSKGTGVDCKINIAYNKQAGLCSTEWSQKDAEGRLECRGWGELCQSDPEYDFDFSEGSEYFTSFSITDVFGEDAELLVTAPGTRDIPVPLRPGDFNVNGYPNLLMTIRDAKTGHHKAKVLQNLPCGNHPGCVKGRRGRGFEEGRGKGWSALENIEDAVGASWIDLDDDGSLDIMVHRTGHQSGERVTFIQNNFYHDAFFLKAQVLNGACDHAVCTPIKGGKKYSGNGASYSGASFKFTAFDTGGTRHAQQVAQLPQTGYHALNSPHTFIGLGRTNNYIENLVVGTSINPPDNLQTLEQLIPNSQVIINPPWPGKDGSDPGKLVTKRSAEWRTELFLHPGDWIPWVAAAVAITVVTLFLVVVWLGEREKREDEKERRRALHAINFQAL